MGWSTYVLLGLVVLVAAGGAAWWYRGSLSVEQQELQVQKQQREVEAQQQQQNKPEPTSDIPSVEEALGPAIPKIEETVQVALHTTKGDITVELYGKEASLTVGNFVKLARSGFYDGTSFHRVIPDFMIQGGDPLSKDPTLRARHGTGGPEYVFPDEINSRKIVRGSLAMANRGPNTNGSQFFIVTAEATPHLDGRHTNFGQVIEGMDVVEAIAQVERDARDNPLEPVVIERVEIIK